MIRIFNNYFNFVLNTKLSDAIESGNSIRSKIDENGINIFVAAYSDLVNMMFEIILENFFSDNLNDNRWKYTSYEK